jgi:hypothetical protein
LQYRAGNMSIAAPYSTTTIITTTMTTTIATIATITTTMATITTVTLLPMGRWVSSWCHFSPPLAPLRLTAVCCLLLLLLLLLSLLLLR